MKIKNKPFSIGKIGVRKISYIISENCTCPFAVLSFNSDVLRTLEPDGTNLTPSILYLKQESRYKILTHFRNVNICVVVFVYM